MQPPSAREPSHLGLLVAGEKARLPAAGRTRPAALLLLSVFSKHACVGVPCIRIRRARNATARTFGIVSYGLIPFSLD